MEDLIALHMEDYYSGASVSPTENTKQGKILVSLGISQ